MASNSGTDENRPLKERVETMLRNSIVPPLTSQCCIFRVPKVLRKIKESAYTPKVISIGPFHHKNDELQFMEKQKMRYLDHVLHVYKVNLDTLLTIIKDSEESVRQSYREFIELSSDDFVTMVLLDGVFIVEYFTRHCNRGLKDQNDKVLYDQQLRKSIWNDLMLLENQLPFFVLESLYNLISQRYSSPLPFLKISCLFFYTLNKQKITPQAKVLHFTDLIRTFHLKRRNMESIHRESNEETEHISVHSAKELEESGINFKSDSSKCLLDVKFAENDGMFLIPRLTIQDSTESIFRNIMALEQHVYVNETYICDYIILMDTLIDTYKDVEVLVRKCIISNNIGDHQSVAALFNNLGLEIIHRDEKSNYAKLINELDKYYKKPQHKWRASFIRDYFSSPWQIASVFAATILLVLTLLQTIKAF